MTTIAVDKYGAIAADGQTSSGGERVLTNAKKIHPRPAEGDRPARIFAVAGTRSMTQALIEWYEEGYDPRNVPPNSDDGWTLIVIEAERIAYFTCGCAYPNEVIAPCSFGSGGDYIIGLLHEGATARRAVEVASRIDIHTGGEIQVVDIKEALGIQQKPLRLARG